MTEISGVKWGSPVWLIFSKALAFFGWGCGFFASVLVSGATGLLDFVRRSETEELVSVLPLGLTACLLMLLMRPRDWRQLGLLLALGVPLSFWFGLAEDAAQAAQYVIARDGSFFILISVFTMLAMPVFAPVWRMIERTSMAEPDEGKHAWAGGVVGAIAILLPGLMAGTLAVDILRAVSWVQGDSEQAMAWMLAPMFFAVFPILPSAQPEGERHWIILEGVLMAAMIASVLAGAGLLSLAQPLDQPTGGTFFLGVTTFAAGPAIGWAARLIAHHLARGDSPWRAHARSRDEGEAR